MLLAFFCLIALASYSVESASVSKKLTKSPTGCPCWFDLEGKVLAPNSCACCKTGGRQCGYPRHNLCTNINRKDSRTGCNGNYFFLKKDYPYCVCICDMKDI